MQNFIPDTPPEQPNKVPTYEANLRDKDVPGRRVELPIERYQKQIIELLIKLGAIRVQFTPGTFPGSFSKTKRYGYIIEFNVNGGSGRMECAALPLERETPQKKDRALAQALYLLTIWLEGEVYSSVYRPGAIPLIPFLIGATGRTVTEELRERGLPQLPGANGVVVSKPLP